MSVFCPSCGARNPATAVFCGDCGRALPTPEQLAALWGSQPRAGDARRERDSATQPTTAFVPAGRFDAPASAAPPAGNDAWAYQDSRRPPPIPPQAVRRRGGPGGCVLTILALLLICAVGGVLVGLLVVRPYLRDQTRDELREAAATQVREIDTLPLLPSGELVVTEEEINRSLRENEYRYAPIKDPHVEISPGGFEVTFELEAIGLSGLESSYTGNIEVRDGALVVTDGDIDGPAAQALSADDVAEIAEEQLAILLDRSDVRATDVELADGELRVTTEPVE